MKRMRKGSLIFILVVICLLTCSCQVVQTSVKPLTRLPSLSATQEATRTKTLIPSATSHPSITQEIPSTVTQTHVPSTSTSIPDQRRSLILYVDYPFFGGILDTDTGEARSFGHGMLPIEWSPSGDRLLLRNTLDGAFYITDEFGQNMEQLYKPEMGIAGHDTRWLTDDRILAVVEVREEDSSGYYPVFFLLDSRTGEAQHLSDGSLLIATSPAGDLWLENHGICFHVHFDGRRVVNTGPINLASNGVHEWHQPMTGFLPDGRGLIYVQCDDDICHIVLSEIAAGEILQGKPIYNLGETITTDSLRVSPNGSSLVWYDPWGEEFIVFDLVRLQVKKHLMWPLEISGRISFLWSPDSNALAISQVDLEGDQFEVILMDIATGERIIEYSDVPAGILLDWRYFPIE